MLLGAGADHLPGAHGPRFRGCSPAADGAAARGSPAAKQRATSGASVALSSWALKPLILIGLLREQSHFERCRLAGEFELIHPYLVAAGRLVYKREPDPSLLDGLRREP